ncbi:D-alanyl-D-alanine carboxypeptidase family protein [Brachybacterium kimchii]|uniref:D-alanyl-D-alanine carboxypeptidase family protein n=1 Tax=Brachybacterium kimchii TaxID=2942909 RepID=A0ABY4NCZ6_9MICO|nr:D-alanyl-D-alanine carboxypeptidase family protein [Brachybacterium kimchii]UQN31807.1 D-alanyl-D-alanine carboxypeptidase family protein [Brachybacterium kimchii]
MRKWLVFGLVGVLVLGVATFGGLILIMFQTVSVTGGMGASSAGSATCTQEGGTDTALSVGAGAPSAVAGLDKEQTASLALIMKVGEDEGMSERAQLVAGMTAYQESKLKNITGGDRDSVGEFQQRPSQGWGTAEQLTDPSYAARAFYKGVDTANGHIPGLADIKGWESMSLTEAAQAVQKSGYPDAYAQHEVLIRGAMGKLAGVSLSEAAASLTQGDLGCDSDALTSAPKGLPTQAQLTKDSSSVKCPEGTTDLGVATGGFQGKRVPIRLCSINGTVCTGSDCRSGELNGKARGEVILNSLVAPHFMKWLKAVRADGFNPQFSSSFRSWETQVSLSGSSNAASPGHSNHQMGAAVDIAGLPGTYTRGNCSGAAKDGSCQADNDAWKSYHKRGLENGGLFHDEEFWHLEWVITRASERDVPFIKAA